MSDDKNPIKHVVVVMLENRSYDNVLGWLYGSGNAAPYDKAPCGQAKLNGLTGKETNPNPFEKGTTIGVGNQTGATRVDGSGPGYAPTAVPIIDPGEPFKDMAQQITGSADIPTSNPYASGMPTSKTLMKGFTTNYVAAKKVTAANIADIMNYHTPAQLPVTSFLAHNYAVCDSWFASVPTQTFTNRVFGFCAAPGVAAPLLVDPFSLVDDAQYLVHDNIIIDDLLQLPSVMSYLDDKNPGSSPPNWKVYFHDYSISAMTVPYVQAIAASDSNQNVSTFDNSDWGNQIPKGLKTLPRTFVDDIANGTLPPFAFIEPRYSDNHSSATPHPAANSNHPGPAAYLSLNGVTGTNPPIDAASGELLLMDIYNTLRNSTYWDSTLLLITYDEHGGLFDHVVPPKATPPGTINWNGQTDPPICKIPAASDDGDSAAEGFKFNVFGGRVPTIAVSKYIKPGTTLCSSCGTPFDHTSIVRTVLECFGDPGANLTERDWAAPSVLLAVDANPQNATGTYAGPILTAPAAMVFHLREFQDRLSQLLQISAGGRQLAVTSNAEWLSVSVGSGAIQPITVTVDKKSPTRLKHGTYTGELTVSGSGQTEVVVPVTLVVPLL